MQPSYPPASVSRNTALIVAMTLKEAAMDPLLTTKEAANLLGVSQSFLERDRWAGARIPFVRVGSRAVRYRRSDLQAFLESRMRRSTSDVGGNA